ncbi:unnamed protein product, partial [Iphiclides podalirius]
MATRQQPDINSRLHTSRPLADTLDRNIQVANNGATTITRVGGEEASVVPRVHWQGSATPAHGSGKIYHMEDLVRNDLSE